MKKILILSTSDLTTGALFHINQCIKALEDCKDFDVFLHISSTLKIDSTLKINLSIINFCRFKLFNVIYIFIYIPFYAYFKKVDLIYCPWGLSPLFSSAKVIVGAHNPLPLVKVPLFSNKSLFKLLYWLCLKQADIVKVPSYSFANFLNKFYNIKFKKLKIIYHGVNIEEWRRLIDLNNNKNKINDNTNSHNFIFWSWFHDTKGIEQMLIGFSQYIKNMDYDCSTNLILCGRFSSIKYKNKINSIIENLGIKYYIQFHINPDHSKLIKLICSSDGIILPFRYETFGFPYVEARIFNKPIAVAANLVSNEISENQCYEYDADSIDQCSQAFTFLKSNTFTNKKYIISSRYHASEEIKNLSNLFSSI